MTEDKFGARVAGAHTTFGLWAPAAQTVELLLDRPIVLTRQDGGWYTVTLSDAGAGTRYQYRIDGQLTVPDPASSFQPDDVFGPSEVIDHSSFSWRATDWKGRPWHEIVILEAHVGTFTAEGTYRALIDRLDHLVATGITAIELMPLNDFPGRRNWGYDGVLWYAPDSSYGRPEDLKALVDAAHLRGLAVFLDVVYNHFGPDGNFLGRYAPEVFDQAASTPWGAAIDYDRPEVRAFAIESALQYLRDYRFDGLRLDAVHAIGTPHRKRSDGALLHDLSRAVGELARRQDRHIHLVLENDDNEAALLAPAADPPDGRYRAQWNDDFHHVWHVLLTGEDGGYYRDYADAPRARLGRVLTSGFAYQGEPSAHRDRQPRGEASGHLSPLAFVDFLQNHDQIGNRALGDRLAALARPEAIDAALAVMLLAPMPPLLFMGEEWGSRQPFPFFCDFEGELADAVRRGRRREFKAAYERFGDAVPDPLDEATFRSAKLDWDARDTDAGQRRLTLVRGLLRVRQRDLVPLMTEVAFAAPTANSSPDTPVVTARYRLGQDRMLALLANLSDAPQPRPQDDDGASTPIWGGAPPATLPPWSVSWQLA
ncbi:MAG: malto-oligosyltrehalose trehalohydrolase [Xanthobacteraceae bacterium]|nr:malto-oligosyltrehalose trehalohydrolase [Xanthobacteraceae bacterium]